MLGCLNITHARIDERPFTVADGHDRFKSDMRGAMLEQALQFLRHNGKTGETLVAIPDGSLLNYLARMPGSIRTHKFMPPEFVLIGEGRILAELDASPPDWIVLIHADTSIYDVRFFGRDYAQELVGWIREHYVSAELIGARPFVGSDFGILIMRRR
jgi:hypothetical protein